MRVEKLLLGCVAVLLATVGHVQAGFIVSIFDDGTNLTMTATGTYDLSGAPVTISSPGNSFAFNGLAGVGPNVLGGLYGWQTGVTDRYSVTYSGSLSGTSFDFTPQSVSVTNPFVFNTSSSLIGLPTGASPIGTVNNTAVFNGVTLASLGMVPGESVTVSWAGDSATIQTSMAQSAVPEPASIALFGIGAIGLAFVAVRRRRRENSESVA